MSESEGIDFEGEILRLRNADPFIPFVIVVNSGDRVEVTDPIQLAMAGNTVAVVHPRQGTTLIRKNQISAVIVHEPA